MSILLKRGEWRMVPETMKFPGGEVGVRLNIRLVDCVSVAAEKQGALETVFLDGKHVLQTSLSAVRARVNSSL